MRLKKRPVHIWNEPDPGSIGEDRKTKNFCLVPVHVLLLRHTVRQGFTLTFTLTFTPLGRWRPSLNVLVGGSVFISSGLFCFLFFFFFFLTFFLHR